MDVRAVAFDLDETLATVVRPRADLLATATDRADAPALSREEYLDAHAEHSGADTREPVFAALLDGRDTAATPADVAAAYREAVTDALAPVPGAPALVASLRERYPVGLLTDGPVATQEDKLDRLGWRALFDATVVTGSLPEPKPDAGAFLALAAALGVPVESVVYVGDHPVNDVEGARDAGMVPVQVLYDGGPDPHPDAAATVERDALAEALPTVLDGL
ncbi:HAD family hydrolase [Halosegnis marinus]|uniref:HAD family hydrolase n=1 Tax=Halosegnis marinus TaxID=3034023 RepID=A0ABD5ZM17_9EURY|nr:HAD family hydrolase [Halosegnis sp. DT85]